MRSKFAVLLPLLVVLASACSGSGSDSPTGPGPSYNNVAGTYTGPMSGVDQGILLVATISVTVAQSSGTLTGSYAITGQLTDGVNVAAVNGTGTLSGTIASGNNPSVNITVRSGICPAFSANFSGSYDTANSRMTITGPVQIYSSNCASVVLTYPTTFVLNH